MRAMFKFTHMLGLALFVGSLPCHIILGRVVPGGDIPPQGVLFARVMVKIITLLVTAPGITLLALSGFGLLWASGQSWRKAGWIKVHLTLGLVALLNGWIVLVPSTVMLAGLAQELVDGTFDESRWAFVKTVQDVAGTVNLLLALVAMAVAAARLRKPRVAFSDACQGG